MERTQKTYTLKQVLTESLIIAAAFWVIVSQVGCASMDKWERETLGPGPNPYALHQAGVWVDQMNTQPRGFGTAPAAQPDTQVIIQQAPAQRVFPYSNVGY